MLGKATHVVVPITLLDGVMTSLLETNGAMDPVVEQFGVDLGLIHENLHNPDIWMCVNERGNLGFGRSHYEAEVDSGGPADEMIPLYRYNFSCRLTLSNDEKAELIQRQMSLTPERGEFDQLSALIDDVVTLVTRGDSND